MILIALLMMQTAPAADAQALAREIAGTGSLVRLLPTVAAKETEELAKDTPGLTPAEIGTLKETAAVVQAQARERLIAAMAPTYAAKLTPEQMRAVLAFEASPAATAKRDADMAATIAAASVLGGYDYKGSVMAEFCKKTGKGCRK